MPCNYQPVTVRATIAITDPKDVTDTLKEMGVDFLETGDEIVINAGLDWPDGNRNRGTVRLSLSTEGELQVDALPEDSEWIVPMLQARLTAKKLAAETKAKGGYIKSQRIMPNGTIVLVVGAARGDGQLVTMTITGGNVAFRVTGTDLDVCNPLQHHLQHAIGAAHKHTHRANVMARVNQKWGRTNAALVKNFK